MQEIEKTNSEKSLTQDTKEIPSSVYGKQLTTLNEAASQSANLIDDSTRHLRQLMNGLFANQPESEVRLLDQERVRVACLCADQIHKLLKVKVDMIKVSHDISKNTWADGGKK